MVTLIRSFLWIELHLSRQYRWSLIMQVLQFLIFLFIFSRIPVSAETVGVYGGLYIHFVLTGVVYQIFYESILNGPTSRLSELQMTGQLNVVLSAPFARWKILLASGIASVLTGTAKSAVVLIFGAMIFCFYPQSIAVGLLLAGLGFTFILCACLALLNVAGTLLWPRVNLTSFFNSLLLGLLSGVFVPIDSLPNVIRVVAVFNPLKWGLDAFRAGLGISTDASTSGWFFAALALLVVALSSVAAYRKADLVLTRENRYQYF